MSNLMETLHYDIHDFLYDVRVERHPLILTEKHFFYHLMRDATGCLIYEVDDEGFQIKSPRSLKKLCVNVLICNVHVLQTVDSIFLPTNLHAFMLSEAMFYRETRAIEWLVSTWPTKYLNIYDVLPYEDFIEDNYLTALIEGSSTTSLVDGMIAGLLKLKAKSNLKYIDFRNFPHDRKLCKELSRIPILWMRPECRTVENIHDIVSQSLDTTKDKVERYLNRIKSVYVNIDEDFKHGNEINFLTILLDLRISIDDVPFGLSLQQQTPFKFSSSRVWMKSIPEITLLPSQLGKVINPNYITHFEFEDCALSQDDAKLSALLEALKTLSKLEALGLPNSLDFQDNQDVTVSINKSLRNLNHLKRLNFSYCNIHGHLRILLAGLHQKILYLNLRDCRLGEDDMNFLKEWSPIGNLRELNLSANVLSRSREVIVYLVTMMKKLTCLSISYCALNTSHQVLIANTLRSSKYLKVLSMQSYVPLTIYDILEILSICASIKSLQKVMLFPKEYAFPGATIALRKENKIAMILTSYRYLTMRMRQDIELE